MSEASIYPITQFYFQCSGCKAQWMVRAEPPVRNIDEFKAWMAAGKMGLCPKGCGAQTCSVAFRAYSMGEKSKADPFTMFDKETTK